MHRQQLADPELGRLDDVVDLDRHPIHRPASGPWRAMVDEVRRCLADDGAVSLPDFLRPATVEALAAELGALRPWVAVTTDHRDPYAREPRDATDLPTSAWTAGHVTRDMLPPHSIAQRLYVAPGFKAFIAACLGRDRIFEYADPLAGLVATVLPPGGCYGWHYDTNAFVVTLSVQAPDRGGAFEYVPGLRRPGDENLDGLRRVLDGERREVRTLPPNPGSLQLFLGRYSLHRVTEVAGDTDRLTLVLSYSDRPGVIGPVERTRKVYGRVTEAHLVAGGALAGADGLIP
ncbi:MAG: hypothetical protein AAGA37_19540 [Actinomycetota bacterium]